MTTELTLWRRWMWPRWRRVATWSVVVVVVVAAVTLLIAATNDRMVTASHFATLRQDQTALRAFLQRMPKGGDLHVHLTGAVYAEDVIALSAARDMCFRLDDLSVDPPPCNSAGTVPAAQALRDQKLYDRLVNAMSSRFFVPTPGVSGHDQFFNTFGKVNDVTRLITAEMTLAMLGRYAADNVQYAELMVSFGQTQRRAGVVAAIGDERDIAKAWEKAKTAGFEDVIAVARAQVADVVAKVEASRRCYADATNPLCRVRFRYLAQVNRNNSWADVLVQIAIAAELIRREPAVAGLNLVGAEDARVSRTDYADHMRMVQALARDVPVALHAGELWLGLVPPEDLKFHIRDAVTVAGARRIGHGVDLSYEDGLSDLLAAMRTRNVAVEINLTSNDLILGVKGRDHPLPAYLKAGVPVVISTDDAGVSRIDLTNEYVRAARDYGIGYAELQRIARASLAHAFLRDLERRDELARFDRASADFEREVWGALSIWGRLKALVAAPFS